MRTTVNLEDDVYELTSLYARGRGVTLGVAIGDLVRRGHAASPSEPATSRLKRLPNGLLVFNKRGRAITSEMVKKALEKDKRAK